MSLDPTATNPHLYTVVFENARVRVLEYRDQPGDATVPHAHPDSVMYTLSSFDRRLSSGDKDVDVRLEAGAVRWLDAQQHSGTNIGSTETHALFIELKEPGPDPAARAGGTALGPAATEVVVRRGRPDGPVRP